MNIDPHLADSSIAAPTSATSALPRPDDPARTLCRNALAGRLVELPAQPHGAVLTALARIFVQAQALGDPVALVSTRDDLPFVEDLLAHGIDLAALAVVRAPDGPRAGLAADRLLRSSGFGVVAIDLAAGHEVPVAQLARLIRLAALHDAAVLLLTAGATHGSLIPLRLHVTRELLRGGRWSVRVWADKDKRLGPGPLQPLGELRGPPGLR